MEVPRRNACGAQVHSLHLGAGTFWQQGLANALAKTESILCCQAGRRPDQQRAFRIGTGCNKKKLGYYITAKGENWMLVGDEPAAGIILISIKEKSEKPF